MSKLTKFFKHPIQFFKDSPAWNPTPENIDRLIKKNQSKSNKPLRSLKSVITTTINNIPVANIKLTNIDVALYFSGSTGNIYQIEQWVKPLQTLNNQKQIVVIVRGMDVYKWVQTNTEFTCVYCRTIEDLLKVYEDNDFKCILYVNNAYKNFQSLINNTAIHVHINHGESDKTSTITNQSKSYDYTFISGDAAYDKYNLNLIKKDMKKFVKIGRPQLEYIDKFEGLHTDKKIILYAPTWEGTHTSMNFTSLNQYGMPIINQLISFEEFYIIYKPHPNTGSRDKLTKSINKEIIDIISNYQDGMVLNNTDINSLYEIVDLAIFDNSAVAIDYLQYDKPMIMTDLFHNIQGRISKPAITKATKLLDQKSLFQLRSIIDHELEFDSNKGMRNEIKNYFLGDFDYSTGETTNLFVDKVIEVCEERDILLSKLEQTNNITSDI